MMAMPSPMMHDEEGKTPRDGADDSRTRQGPVTARSPVAHVEQQKNDDSSTCSLNEEVQEGDVPRNRETSENESSSSSSSSASKSEYSPEDVREMPSLEFTAAGTELRTGAINRTLSLCPGDTEQSDLETDGASPLQDVLIPAQTAGGIVSASPQAAASKTNGIEGSDTTDAAAGALDEPSLHPLILGSPPRIEDSQLQYSSGSPKNSSSHERSSSSAHGQTVRNHIRRSSRVSLEPHRLSVASFTPTRRNRKRRPDLKSRVYAEETVRDVQDGMEASWELLGHNNGKDMLTTNITRDVASAPVAPTNRDSRSRVYEEESHASSPSYPNLQSLHEWYKRSQQQALALDAKRQRIDDNIDFLSDFCARLSRKSRTRSSSSPGDVYASTERQERVQDERMLNCLEENMQFDLPAYVTSDCTECQHVHAQCKALKERLCQYYDKESDAWALNHFSLSSPGHLSETELELAWLAQESIYCLECPFWDWTFIFLHASAALKNVLREQSPVLVRPCVSDEFRKRQELISKALDGGYRRPHMMEVVARHLELLREREME